MKKLECIVRQEKVKELAEALLIAGVGGITSTEVKGFGTQTSRPPNYLFLPKTKVEIYARDDQVEELIEAIVKCCKDEVMGSGKIAILPLENCVRIRTNERGEKAIF